MSYAAIMAVFPVWLWQICALLRRCLFAAMPWGLMFGAGRLEFWHSQGARRLGRSRGLARDGPAWRLLPVQAWLWRWIGRGNSARV